MACLHHGAVEVSFTDLPRIVCWKHSTVYGSRPQSFLRVGLDLLQLFGWGVSLM